MGLPGLMSAAHQVAGAVAVGAAGRVGAGGGGGDTYHIHIEGIVANPQSAGRQVVQLLRQYKRDGGNAALGIA